MTPRDIIAVVRYTTNDTAVPYRNDDDELVSYVNLGLREMSRLPAGAIHFTAVADFAVVPGAARQAITGDHQAFRSIESLPDGTQILEADLRTMDAYNPSWRSATAGTPKNWLRHPDDRLAYYLYPPPAVSDPIRVRYQANPTPVGLNDTINEIPEALLPALVNYTIYRADAKEDEYANNGRASTYYAAFLAALGMQPGA